MGIHDRATHPFARGRAIERISLIDNIVAEIKDQILSGALKDGDMLASQDELARSLGVSRASLREALNRLNVMGLVEIKHGSGTFVRSAKPPDPNSLPFPLFIADRSSAEELLVAQYHIESATASIAAMNATEEEVGELCNQLKNMRSNAVLGNVNDFIVQDLRFHTSIAEASKNQVLARIFCFVGDLSRQFIQNYCAKYAAAIHDILEYHDAIFQAIRKRDLLVAREKMRAHIGHLAIVTFGSTNPLFRRTIASNEGNDERCRP